VATDRRGEWRAELPANTLPLYRAYNNAFPQTGPKNAWIPTIASRRLRRQSRRWSARDWRITGGGLANCYRSRNGIEREAWNDRIARPAGAGGTGSGML
jgi:hypothetical protein